MSLPPLIERELRCAARDRKTYHLRLFSGALTVLVGFAFILPGAHNIALVGTSSRGVFWWLAAVMTLYAVVMALFLAGDAIAGERRERTLELLRLTQLQPIEILLGKLFTSGIGAIQSILAFALTLALTLLVGGVTLGEYFRIGVLALNAVFLGLSIGLLSSSLVTDGRIAAILGIVLVTLIAFVPLFSFGTASITGTTVYQPRWWELLSPIATFRLCESTAATGSTAPYWISLCLQHALGWTALFLAAAWLKNHWRSMDSGFVLQLSSFSTRLPVVHQPRRYDEVEHSEDRELLDQNPIDWLLVHKYGSTSHRIGAMVGMGIVSLLVYWVITRWLGRPHAIFFVLLSWHLFAKLWVAWIASHLMTEMRRSGMLELTLTTPLNWHLILDGWLIGLKRVFFLPVAAIIIVELFLAFWVGSSWTAVFGGTGWYVAMLASILGFLFEIYALTWLGLLRGLRAVNTTRAWLATVGTILLLPWAGVAGLFAFAGVGFLAFVSAGIFDLLVTRFVSGLLITIAATAWSIDQLRSHLQSNLTR